MAFPFAEHVSDFYILLALVEEEGNHDGSRTTDCRRQNELNKTTRSNGCPLCLCINWALSRWLFV